MQVRITATQEVTYDQIVEMTKEQYDQLTAHDDSTLEDRDASPLVDWIDFQDILESGEFKNITIQKEKKK